MKGAQIINMNRDDSHKHEFIFDTKFKTLAIPAYVVGVCNCGKVIRITIDEYKRKYRGEL